MRGGHSPVGLWALAGLVAGPAAAACPPTPVVYVQSMDPSWLLSGELGAVKGQLPDLTLLTVMVRVPTKQRAG